MRGVLIVLTASACGRLGFDAHAHAPADALDAAVDAVIDAGEPSCGTTVMLDDGFDDGVPGPLFVAQQATGVTIAEADSGVSFTFGTVAAEHYAAYKSLGTFAPEGACAVVDVAALPDPSVTGAASYMKLLSSNQQLELFAYEDQIDCRTHEDVDVNIQIVGHIAWDPQATRFWRIHQIAGVTYWAVSSDGAAFVPMCSAAFAIADPVQIELGAGAITDITGGGTARFAAVTVTTP
jgi:hypothetical protein